MKSILREPSQTLENNLCAKLQNPLQNFSDLLGLGWLHWNAIKYSSYFQVVMKILKFALS